MKPADSPYKVCLITSLVVAIGVGALMLYIGFQHNAQGEFWNEDGIDISYSAFIFTTWFVPSFIFFATMTVGPVAIYRLIRRYFAARKRT